MSACLPEVVQKTLERIAEAAAASKGDVNREIRVVKKSNSEIGCSCNIVAEGAGGGRLDTFYVKYLDFGLKFSDESLVYFNNETIFYGEIVPLFAKILEGLTDKHESELDFAPKCYEVGYLTDKTEPYIIMEDLLTRGYSPFEEKELTVEEARMVLEELGRFHAFSFAARERYPAEFIEMTGRLTEVLFSKETRMASGKFFIHAIHDALKLAKQSFPPNSAYVEKLALYTLNVFETMIEVLEGTEDDYNYKVVTHGDLWPNNVVYNRNNDGKIAFLDFHACRLSSPVHDLQLLLLVGLDTSTRRRHGPDLILSYHRALCRHLERLGMDPNISIFGVRTAADGPIPFRYGRGLSRLTPFPRGGSCN
ncbi:unnamed protein product [Callosobruchus maculatus]|uniref:CHK kinase-like domain-containing protein n=1 Tax=Callosobruchus maculatus TaxID=64391 RepID=A0A653C8U2_CALMS|nr:unnamed protein product [Callosobruchus maculatus]